MTLSKKKKVLIVDDSAFMRKVITDILSESTELEVLAAARNGRDALEKLKTLTPDVITLDVEMPIMDGLEALKEIMKVKPTPVVMLSSTTEKGAENTVLAMEWGAVDFVAKPGGAISLNLTDIQDEIIEKVLAASTVSVKKLTEASPTITRNRQTPSIPRTTIRESKKEVPIARQTTRTAKATKRFTSSAKTVIAIGTSTGGPRALQEVLTNLPKNLAAPIVIVQHMPPGFTKSLADRLDTLSHIHVKEVEHGEVLENGTAYIAPGGQHFTVRKLGMAFVAEVSAKELPRKGHRPSVDMLFESVARLPNIKCLAVVMTGMGNDGMEGVKYLKTSVETIAIAESQKTSVVYGMPRAIVDAQLADEVTRLDNIAQSIVDIVES